MEPKKTNETLGFKMLQELQDSPNAVGFGLGRVPGVSPLSVHSHRFLEPLETIKALTHMEAMGPVDARHPQTERNK